MHWSIATGLTVMLLLGAATSATASAGLRGVALVVGESDYDSDKLRDLGNPARDADAISGMLTRLGFKVRTVTDEPAGYLREDIDRFVADAKKADVALVYYSGHGIEAGGTDYLVPTDADLSTPEAAGQSLVSVQDMLDRLARTVPVTIALIDACRSNAFPAGTTIALPNSEQTIEVATTGLGALRGPSPVARVGVPDDNLGMVIGFAAAPGEAALDGPAGENSPYASALLKHLGAGGYSFGDLMTMVSEEVYLKTDARQLPWTNSSLRRVLSFGAPASEASPDLAAIVDGRRQLLLSIAGTPDNLRKQVENAASAAAVPMDAIYGLLKALGQDVPTDPTEVNGLLKEQTDTIKKLMADHETLTSTDPEIVRLSTLAQTALDEGALDVSVKFWEEAKARYTLTSQSLDATEADLKARRLEGGALLARTADAYELKGDFDAAAENFQQAFDQVLKWDLHTAWLYKSSQARELTMQGDRRGDNAALLAAIESYGELLKLATRETDAAAWGETQSSLCNALMLLGEREGSTEHLQAAASACKTALEERTRERSPFDWAATQSSLGNVLFDLGQRESGAESLGAAVNAYFAALQVRTRRVTPLDWAETMTDLGNALLILGQRENGTKSLQSAASAYRAALEEETRERVPLSWAQTQSNLGVALETLGERESGTVSLTAAVTAFRAALTERTRELVPLDWAETQNNLGNALLVLGQRESGIESLKAAVTAQSEAIKERTRERVPLDWAVTQNNLGNAFLFLGKREKGTGSLHAAVTAYNAALEEATRERVPLYWATMQSNLGEALQALGERESGSEGLLAAMSADQAALEVRTRQRAPLDWARTENNLGEVFEALGERESGTVRLQAAVVAYRAALEERTRERVPLDWAATQSNLGRALGELRDR